MRSLTILSVMVALFIALAVYYSFWVAIGVMQFGSMLAITLAAFTASSRSSETPKAATSTDSLTQPQAKDPAASKDMKAA